MKSVKNVTRLRCDDEIRRHIEEIGKRERERERERELREVDWCILVFMRSFISR